MGVIPGSKGACIRLRSTPHTHGGDSPVAEKVDDVAEYSPYTWG